MELPPEGKTARALGTSVRFHAALIKVAAAWYLTSLFLGFLLSNLVPMSVGVIAFGFAPLLTALVCWRCGKAMLRTSRDVWPRLTMSFSATPVVGLLVLWVGLHLWLSQYELTGPTSPAGLTVIIEVSDAGLGIGADFYSDVRIVDATSRVLAEWKDPEGQFPPGGPELLRDSMRWVSADTLEFTTRGHRDERPAVQLTVR